MKGLFKMPKISLKTIKKHLKSKYPNIDFNIEKDSVINIVEVSFDNSNNLTANEVRKEIESISHGKIFVSKTHYRR